MHYIEKFTWEWGAKPWETCVNVNILLPITCQRDSGCDCFVFLKVLNIEYNIVSFLLKPFNV